MAKLLCICGKIGCGKTYYANRLKEQEHAVFLSTDEVTYDLTNNQQGEGYDEFARKVNLYLRKKQWTDRIRESVDIFGSQPERLGSIIMTAVTVLALLISKVLDKARELSVV